MRKPWQNKQRSPLGDLDTDMQYSHRKSIFHSRSPQNLFAKRNQNTNRFEERPFRNENRGIFNHTPRRSTIEEPNRNYSKHNRISDASMRSATPARQNGFTGTNTHYRKENENYNPFKNDNQPRYNPFSKTNNTFREPLK